MKYITVSYDLYDVPADAPEELIEKAPAEHPFQFISELGMTLEQFEKQVAPLEAGQTFDFTLQPDEAYGPYEDERVLEMPREQFCVDGKLHELVYPGNIIPLMGEDGYRFMGIVLDVTDAAVVIDLNHPCAGKTLHYVGTVITSREATGPEIASALNAMSGEGGCGGNCGGCGGGCHDGGCDGNCDCKN